MSIAFNDTDTRKGLVQFYEKELGLDVGEVSGSTSKLKDFAADVNVSFDDYLAIAFRASGKFQYDDSNHGDYPIIRANLVAGQRDIAFSADAGGNLILDFHKVLIADEQGVFHEVDPVDPKSEDGMHSFFDGLDAEGVPNRYQKTGNGFLLDPIPSYSLVNGFKAYVNREPAYFVHTDTDKKPGVPVQHKWFYIKPAQEHARRNNLAAVARLDIEVKKLEDAIALFFGGRGRDRKRKQSNKITPFQ